MGAVKEISLLESWSNSLGQLEHSCTNKNPRMKKNPFSMYCERLQIIQLSFSKYPVTISQIEINNTLSIYKGQKMRWF